VRRVSDAADDVLGRLEPLRGDDLDVNREADIAYRVGDGNALLVAGSLRPARRSGGRCRCPSSSGPSRPTKQNDPVRLRHSQHARTTSLSTNSSTSIRSYDRPLAAGQKGWPHRATVRSWHEHSLCRGHFASPGRRIVADHLADIIQTNRIDLAIANAENAAGGFGITPPIAQELFALASMFSPPATTSGQEGDIRLSGPPAAPSAAANYPDAPLAAAWPVLCGRAMAWSAPC